MIHIASQSFPHWSHFSHPPSRPLTTLLQKTTKITSHLFIDLRSKSLLEVSPISVTSHILPLDLRQPFSNERLRLLLSYSSIYDPYHFLESPTSEFLHLRHLRLLQSSDSDNPTTSNSLDRLCIHPNRSTIQIFSQILSHRSPIAT
jgi:hypothetical protein